ncbi:sulfatase [Halalkalicoccus ordinarius]|uniref:sulfatase n=1 Tax=Halalkalicoccus ordinarius TaxID=3116651 RepID=UPI00300EDBEA
MQDVLWITLESVRQDRTSMGGHDRDTTPNIADLAAKGASFDRCYSHDIWTRASSASILTGHASSAHRTWSNDASLPEAITTIPETFQKAGYRTACVSPNPQLSVETGLARGFDDFHYLARETLLNEVSLADLSRWGINYRQHTGGLTADGAKHCLGYLENQIAKGHIKDAARNDESLFLYVHHGDTHHAYSPPVAWRETYIDEIEFSTKDALRMALSMSSNIHEDIAAGLPYSEDEWDALLAMYDATLAYVDQLVGDLVEYAQSQLQDPIIIITSDHGEAFGEDGLLAHMLAGNSAIANIPMVINGIKDLRGDGLIQHADAMAMLCADLEIDATIPIGSDIREDERTFAVTQHGPERAEKKLEALLSHNSAFDVNRYPQGIVTDLWTEDWRYQQSGGQAKLFNLPDENIVDDQPEAAESLKSLVRSWMEENGQPVGSTGAAEFGAEQEQRLRDLGYL